MNKLKTISRYIAGSVLAIGCTLNQSFAAYTSLYFDSSIDTFNYEFDVDILEETGETEVRGEDKYVKDGGRHKRTSVYGTMSTGSSSKKWENALNPSDDKKPYEAKDIEIFETWAKGPTVENAYPVSKLVTVPAMKLQRLEKNGKIGKEQSLTDEHNKGRALIDIVNGTNRGVDESGLPKHSMVSGLNELLRSIEHLKGEYESEEDFINVLMGLAYIMEKGGKQTIVFKGDRIYSEESDSSGKKDEEDEENISADEVEGNGQDITVTMAPKGNVVREFTVTQEGSGYKFQVRFPIKAYTGYILQSDKGGGVGDIKMTFKDREDTQGKAIQLVNGSAVGHSRVSEEDVKFLNLSDLIRHALIKASVGATSQGKMNGAERFLYNIFDTLLKMFESTLGLFQLEELIYNSADINEEITARSNYYLGMYPEEWHKLISVIFAFTGVISVSVLVFAILKVFGKLTFDSMNVGKRFSLKEDIARILKTIGAMMLFTMAIHALALMNYLFVKTVYSGLTNGSINFLDVNNLGASGLANIVYRIIMVFVNFYINVIYIVRSVNLALLTALAPAFIVSLSFGKEQIFATYVKEIVGNIFLQSFHSIVLMFILEAQTLILVNGTNSMFTVVIISLAIIPVTKVFKDMVMPSTLADVGQNMAQRYGNNVKNIATGIATGAATVGTLAGGKIIADKMNKGDAVRDKISGIGKQYSTDMHSVLGEATKAGGVSNYLKELGIPLDDEGKVLDNLEDKLLGMDISEKDKNKVQALAAFSEQISDEDIKAMETAQGLEKLMDMKTFGASKNLNKAVQSAKKMGEKKSGQYNVENSVAKMREGLKQSMSESGLGKVSSTLGGLSNGNNVYKGDSRHMVSKKAFDTFGLNKVSTGLLEGKEGSKITWKPNQSALSGRTIPKGEDFNKLPRDVQGMLKITENLGGAQKELTHYKSALQKAENAKEVNQESVDQARANYDEAYSNVMTSVNSVAKEYGLSNVEVIGGPFNLQGSDMTTISCESLYNFNDLNNLQEGGISYQLDKNTDF